MPTASPAHALLSAAATLAISLSLLGCSCSKQPSPSVEKVSTAGADANDPAPEAASFVTLTAESPGDTRVKPLFCPGPCGDELVAFVEGSQKTLKIAAYGLNYEPLVKAILDAHARGVKVEVLLDAKKHRRASRSKHDSARPAFSELTEAGIAAKLVECSPIESFHHKTMMSDSRRVLTGSLNFSNGSVGKLQDTVMLLEGDAVAGAYETYFAARWQEEPHRLDIQHLYRGKDIEVYFGPGKDMADGLLNLIRDAKQTIDINVVVLSFPPIQQALMDARRRGVKVRLLVSFTKNYPRQNVQESMVNTLRKVGVNVHHYNHHNMHHKFMIVDRSVVAAGSPGYDNYPMTITNEDYVIIRNRAVARSFLGEMKRGLKATKALRRKRAEKKADTGQAAGN